MLLILLSGSFDPSSLGKAVLLRAARDAGISLTAESFRFGLTSGLRLGGVTAEGEYGGGSYDLSVRELTLKHRFLPLLSGTIAVDRIVLDTPDLRLTTGGVAVKSSSAPRVVQSGVSPAGLDLEVSDVRIDGGSLLIRNVDGRGSVAVTGLTATLRDLALEAGGESPAHRLFGTGSFRAGELVSGELTVRDLQGNLEIDQGQVTVRELSGSTDAGDLTGELQLDFKPSLFAYRVELGVDPLDLNEIAGLGPDGTLGSGDLQFSGRGSGTDRKALAGGGKLRVRDGRIPSHPILVAGERILGLRGIVGSDYRGSDATILVENERVHVSGFSLESEIASVGLEGWAGLDGTLNMVLLLRVPVSVVEASGSLVQVLRVLADEEGRVAVPLKVTGTREDPSVGMDVEELVNEAAGGVGRFLRRKFGTSDEQNRR